MTGVMAETIALAGWPQHPFRFPLLSQRSKAMTAGRRPLSQTLPPWPIVVHRRGAEAEERQGKRGDPSREAGLERPLEGEKEEEELSVPLVFEKKKKERPIRG